MPGLHVKILITLAVIAIGYAFVCNIRIAQKAGRLADWLRKERPDLWSELNPVARNWNGGHPALKLLHKRNVVGLPRFDREYERLRILERQLFWALVTGSACLGVVILGMKYFGWDW